MNLLADESVDGPIVARLRQEGHEIVYVAELSPSINDEEVLQQANARAALLVTADKDFGELVFRLLLRLGSFANRCSFPRPGGAPASSALGPDLQLIADVYGTRC